MTKKEVDLISDAMNALGAKTKIVCEKDFSIEVKFAGMTSEYTIRRISGISEVISWAMRQGYLK